MKNFLLIMSIFFLLSVNAQETKNKNILGVVDPDLDTKSLEGPGVVVVKPDNKPVLMPRNERDQAMEQVLTSDELSKMDELDRDMLMRSLLESPFEYAVEKYPQIGKERLLKLKKVLTK